MYFPSKHQYESGNPDIEQALYNLLKIRISPPINQPLKNIQFNVEKLIYVILMTFTMSC